ncbi:MAG: hypothetical protein PHU85_00210 [Phycisphaerae bacterium]|nr:hypothetical protein [Phycisphaerae bacterium]
MNGRNIPRDWAVRFFRNAKSAKVFRDGGGVRVHEDWNADQIVAWLEQHDVACHESGTLIGADDDGALFIELE